MGNESYIINFDYYLTKSTELYPKLTISKKDTGFDIKLFMKHD